MKRQRGEARAAHRRADAHRAVAEIVAAEGERRGGIGEGKAVLSRARRGQDLRRHRGGEADQTRIGVARGHDGDQQHHDEMGEARYNQTGDGIEPEFGQSGPHAQASRSIVGVAAFSISLAVRLSGVS